MYFKYILVYLFFTRVVKFVMLWHYLRKYLVIVLFFLTVFSNLVTLEKLTWKQNFLQSEIYLNVMSFLLHLR